MVELPERTAQVRQADEALRGKIIVEAERIAAPFMNPCCLLFDICSPKLFLSVLEAHFFSCKNLI